MQIEELDLNTRNQIYNSTKKVIRKYQKGISSGKLTAEKFADNIFTNKILLDILDESIINQADFQNSYINYINSLMQKQNENFKNYMDSKHNKTIIRSTVSLQILLKNILNLHRDNIEICPIPSNLVQFSKTIIFKFSTINLK